MVAIVAFIILSFLGNYFASVNYLNRLKNIESAHDILGLVTQSLDVLETASSSLEKLNTEKDLSNIHFSFKTSHTILTQNLRLAIIKAKNIPEIIPYIEKAIQTALLLEESAMSSFNYQFKLLTSPDPRLLEDAKNEVMVVHQFNTETKEHLRKVQIEVRLYSDAIFKEIIKDRLLPLQVALVFGIAFLLFIVIFGFNLIKKIINSITSLIEATSHVSNGDLEKEAPILNNDELGRLTYSFNNMVKSIKEKQSEVNLTLRRIKKLQNITASFSEALTMNQVCEVTINSIQQCLGANYGVISILNAERTELELKYSIGYNPKTLEEYGVIPLTKKTPFVDSVRYQQAVFIETLPELQDKYPKLISAFEHFQIESLFAVPLIIGSDCLGGFTFHFTEPMSFTQEDRDFIIAISGQCAQAIHRAQLYDEAKENIIARDEFISIASHELKTPLTPLKLQLQLVHKQIEKGNLDALNPEKIKKHIETADNQINRISKLIEDLLDVSKITLGKLILHTEQLKLNEVIQEVVASYGHQLKNSLEKVELSLAEDLEIKGDKIRIEQVLINLLTNAVKYAPGKAVKVSTYKKGNVARIVVTDQGPGIAKENQVRIFNRFERIRDRDNVGGLGLGLYISAKIVEAHHGKIWVESDLGTGASFIIELPLGV